MKLKKLDITNFRCFDSLSIDWDEQLTVLVARNGQGKSSVLDAIRIGLWPFVGGFDLAHTGYNDPANAISVDDARMLRKHDSTIRHDQSVRYDEMVRQFPCEIALKADWSFQVYDEILLDFHTVTIPEERWIRSRKSEAKGTKTRDDSVSRNIKFVASIAQKQVRNPESPEIDLPVFGYYGICRLCSEKRLTEKKSKQGADFYMRLFGYRDCLDPASSYKHFADWFTWISECYWEDKINQSKKGLSSETDSVWSNSIQVVQQVTNILLVETGWHTLEYSIEHEKSLVLKHDEHGTLKVELLSDGIRGVLAMVGDIAYRCIKLNPHLGLNAAKESSGVVMIDEVDMHLHPAWQQTILGNLCKAFPKIQFIVTTHSPQVVQTVSSHQIRILDGNQVYSAEAGTKGAESSRILKRIFGTDIRPQNDPNTILLNEYLDLVYADKWNDGEAQKKRKELDNIYQGNEPELTKADLYIENRIWELEIEENQ